MPNHAKLKEKGITVIPFFIALLLFPALLFSTYTRFTPQLKTAMVQISEMRFRESSKLIANSREKDAENRVADYLDAAILCIRLFLNEDQQALKDQQGILDNYIERIEELPQSDPNRNLFLGEIYVAQAILNGKFRNNLSAAWQFYRAYQLLTENHQRHPEFIPTAIPLGVLYCAIGSLPEDYRRIASVLGFEGDVSEGLSMLRKAYFTLSRDPATDFYANYAGFVYSFVSFQLEPDTDVSPRSLNLDLTSSSFLLYLQSRISYENGKVEEAAHWLDRRPRGEHYTEFYHLDYLQGKFLLGLEPTRAAQLLTRYLNESPSSIYRKSAWRYLSWHHLLKGDSVKAALMRIKVLTDGAENTGADRQAAIEARRPWNETLIRARVLFDAARYDSALAVLSRQPVDRCCEEPVERAEYYYRLGRIQQMRGESDGASSSFKKALAIEKVPDIYALGNSALQLALMAEKRGEKEQARRYFKISLKYTQYPFYEGIHQKAKAGLDRIK